MIVRVTVTAIIIAALASMTPASAAETLRCTTSFQGYRVCQGPDGYRSTEWEWQGFTIGDDNRGDRWSTSRWQGIETTTVERPAGEQKFK